MTQPVRAAGYVGLSKDEEICVSALDLVTQGKFAAAREAVTQLDLEQRKTLRRDFALVAEAIEELSALKTSQSQQSLKHILQIIVELERGRFHHRLAWLYSAAALALGFFGAPERGLEWSHRALAQAEQEPQAGYRYELLANHGSILGLAGQYDECIRSIQMAMEEDSDEFPIDRYPSLSNISHFYLEWSRQVTNKTDSTRLAQQAADFAKQAIECAQLSPTYKNGANAKGNYANALLALELFDEAEQVLREALTIVTGNNITNVELMIGMALTAKSKGYWEEAANWLYQAEAMAREQGLSPILLKVFDVKMKLAEQTGQLASALEYAKEYSEYQRVHYTQRLQAISRGAEMIKDVERSRWEAAELRIQSQVMGEKVAALDRQRSLGQMSATLAHELNQPLTAIQTSAQLLKHSFTVADFDPEKQEKMADRIVTNTRRAAEIISKIRNFIKPTQTENIDVDIAQVIRDVVELMRHEALVHGIEVELVGTDAPLHVMGDALQFSQVLVNLARNAIEAMSQSDERILSIAVQTTASEVIVRVLDTGVGFSEATLVVAGTPFFTSKSTGLGIGLSISRDILKLHHGTLLIGNREDRYGASLEIHLPRTIATAEVLTKSKR